MQSFGNRNLNGSKKKIRIIEFYEFYTLVYKSKISNFNCGVLL
nr:MAG TPA: hypothetical protein [Caudoviricetes sp.]